MTVSSLWLFLMVPGIGLQCVSVVLPDRVNLLFLFCKINCGNIKKKLSAHRKINVYKGKQFHTLNFRTDLIK